MKPIIAFLKHNFTLIVVTAFVTAILDLWTLPTTGTSLGWIFAFLLLFAGIGYSIIKKFKK